MGAGDGPDTIKWWDNGYDGLCREEHYRAGDVIRVEAAPEVGWGIAGWSGSDEDPSRSRINRVTMPVGDHAVEVSYVEGCFALSLEHDGEGADPIASPDRSIGCPSGTYSAGEPIDLQAIPASGWQVESWVGVDDRSDVGDGSFVTMPVADHLVSVRYDESCFALSVDHAGLGADPLLEPESSPRCANGSYVAGTLVALTASPSPGWEIGAWGGTDDDSSQAVENEVTMPSAEHLVSVEYAEPCHVLTLSRSGEGAEPVAVELGDGSQWIAHFVAGGTGAPRSIAAGDFDRDLDSDLVTASAVTDQVQWWENDIDGPVENWFAQSVDSSADGPQSVVAVDLDDDGDTDVLGTLWEEDRIGWWKNNDGQGTSWTFFVLENDFEGAYGIGEADLDGDGDLDLFGTAETGGELSWFENGSEPFDWSEQIVEDVLPGARAVASADLDGDGDIDLSVATSPTGDIRWFENRLDTEETWIAHEVGTGAAGARALVTVDLDGDGDFDLLAPSALSAGVTWWENAAGDVWLERSVAADYLDVRTLLAADLDGDGDMDVAAGDFESGAVAWWENRFGDGSLWIERAVAEGFEGVRSLTAADLDADGDLDLAGVSELLSQVIWWENGASIRCSSGSYVGDARVALVANPDPASGVFGWSGTEDDASRALQNIVVMPAEDHEASVHYIEGCFALFLDHAGQGGDPLTDPLASDGCSDGRYVSGEPVDLTAQPGPLWRVGGWLGTEDDLSQSEANRVVMPPQDHAVAVNYTPDCFELTLEHEGQGADPVTVPDASPGCESGFFRAAAPVALMAAPAPGWEVSGWQGTEDDDRQAQTNQLRMPAEAHIVSVTYSLIE